MLNQEFQINQFLLGYCRMLLDGVPDERMAEQPHEGVNHPAWILGHLAFSTDRARELLGIEKELTPEWTALFGPGSKPSSSRADYPSRDELLQAVEGGFAHLRRQVAEATPEQLEKPTTHPRMKDALPTLECVVGFLLTGHLAMHLGQFSMWRRLIGLPPLF